MDNPIKLQVSSHGRLLKTSDSPWVDEIYTQVLGYLGLPSRRILGLYTYLYRWTEAVPTDPLYPSYQSIYLDGRLVFETNQINLTNFAKLLRALENARDSNSR